MESHKAQLTEELKQFLQEGLRKYAPASLALAEFRRQVRIRLQSVVDDFETQFEGIGIPTTAVTNNEFKADSADAVDTYWFIGFKNHAHGAYASYFLEWDFDLKEGSQVWVGASIYAGRKRSLREDLLDALRKKRSLSSSNDLEPGLEGEAILSAYCNATEIHKFPDVFRSVIEEWVTLLTAIGGIQQSLTPVLPSESE